MLHAAARGENITCVMLNNGVFGETGGHMSAATVLGQRTKTSLEGRDPVAHGRPILLADLVARLDGAAFVARCAVNSAGTVARTRKALLRALDTQRAGAGFCFVEILTMCPTGWFVETAEAPRYLAERLGAVHFSGVLEGRAGRRRGTSVSRGPAGSIVVNTRRYGTVLAEGLGRELPGETVVACAGRDEVPDDARVLVTLLEDPDTIRDLLVPSIEWVHVLGAGVDGFPFDALAGRPLTCSRGAAATAISEWVMAALLGFAKALPESWIDAPPERWNAADAGDALGRHAGVGRPGGHRHRRRPAGPGLRDGGGGLPAHGRRGTLRGRGDGARARRARWVAPTTSCSPHRPPPRPVTCSTPPRSPP